MSQTNNAQQRKTVMVVDDEEQLRYLAALTLRRAGYKVYLASSGEDCVEQQIEKGISVDLTVLDCLMADLSAADTLATIKMQRPDTKVILSSGWVEEDEEQLWFSRGVDAILRKPYPPSMLIKKVDTLLAQLSETALVS